MVIGHRRVNVLLVLTAYDTMWVFGSGFCVSMFDWLMGLGTVRILEDTVLLVGGSS